MIKHPIRKKITILFSVVLLAAIFLCWLANNFFLEKYYMMNKQKTLVAVYTMLNGASRSDKLEDETFVRDLENVCEANTIGIFVMGSDGEVVLTSVRDYRIMRDRLYAYLFGQESSRPDGQIWEENDSYTIRTSVDAYMKGEYLEMTGVLQKGEIFFIRTAVEPIRESVALANRFLTYAGVVAVILGAFIIYFVAKHITGPILELAKISEQMSRLNFDVKFTGGKEDEIAYLGQRMNQLSDTLERTISELKTANNELQRDVEQKEKTDEMRKEFLSNVSHELKTPIALIQGYAEGLQEFRDDPESQSLYCEVIIDEAGKMNNMVKNLLNLNELEFGNDVVEMRRFDVAGMIRGMLQSSRILFEQKGARLVFDVQEPVYVWGDEYKLSEVMNNYISNALNHVDGEKIIKVTIEKGAEKARIGVFNTGAPIPEEDVDRIWDKFYKVDKARTREYGGSGVGLSIVKAIMEALHQQYGVINYENGVEFWIKLDCQAG